MQGKRRLSYACAYLQARHCGATGPLLYTCSRRSTQQRAPIQPHAPSARLTRALWRGSLCCAAQLPGGPQAIELLFPAALLFARLAQMAELACWTVLAPGTVHEGTRLALASGMAGRPHTRQLGRARRRLAGGSGRRGDQAWSQRHCVPGRQKQAARAGIGAAASPSLRKLNHGAAGVNWHAPCWTDSQALQTCQQLLLLRFTEQVWLRGCCKRKGHVAASWR
mmetsp:Transcript_22671/g.71315  ORF Transcript_22671/g.71315 Transcript_22671/m.71315 type:complete len:223 (-) Transcript_22671:281-949(-)